MKKTAELVEEAGNATAHRDLRHALGAYATGVVIVSTRDAQGEPVGITVNSFASLSLDPPLILWSLNAQSPSRSSFDRASHFAINVLSVDQVDLSRRFASRTAQKFSAVPVRTGLAGIPLLEDCAAVFQCRRHTQHEGGDHVLYIGHVEDYAFTPEREPLLFHQARYHRLGPVIE